MIEAAEAAADDVNLTDRQRLERQFELLERATVRVEELLGGQTFAGSALSPDGQLLPGRFVLAGPVAVFAAEQGEAVGIAQLEVNSLDPIIVPLTGSSSNQVRTLAADGKGLFPVDLLTAVDIEYGESLHHFRLHSLREFLALDLLAFASSCAHL